MMTSFVVGLVREEHRKGREHSQRYGLAEPYGPFADARHAVTGIVEDEEHDEHQH